MPVRVPFGRVGDGSGQTLGHGHIDRTPDLSERPKGGVTDRFFLMPREIEESLRAFLSPVPGQRDGGIGADLGFRILQGLQERFIAGLGAGLRDGLQGDLPYPRIRILECGLRQGREGPGILEPYEGERSIETDDPDGVLERLLDRKSVV